MQIVFIYRAEYGLHTSTTEVWSQKHRQRLTFLKIYLAVHRQID